MVAKEVYRSCDKWVQSISKMQSLCTEHSLTENGSRIESFGEIFNVAHESLASSNGAFFDHSLLGLIYFDVSILVTEIIYLCIYFHRLKLSKLNH